MNILLKWSDKTATSSTNTMPLGFSPANLAPNNLEMPLRIALYTFF